MATNSITNSSPLLNQPVHSQLPHFNQSAFISLTPDLRPFPLRCTATTESSLPHAHFSTPQIAITTTDYIPAAKFYKVEAILRPWRIQQVSSALLKMGIRGVTVSDVRGFGAQGGLTERQAGSEFSEDSFVAKVKLEIVVSHDQVEAVIEKIIEEARTGEIGDGKIFLIPISDVIRVRTGERGEKAERMTGGRADMFSSTGSSSA